MSVQRSHDVERSRHDLIATAQPSKTNTTPRAVPLTSSACSFQEQRRRGRQRSTGTTAWRTAAGRQLQQKARSVRGDLHEFGRVNKVTHTPSQRLLGNLLREHGDARVLMTVQSQEVVSLVKKVVFNSRWPFRSGSESRDRTTSGSVSRSRGLPAWGILSQSQHGHYQVGRCFFQLSPPAGTGLCALSFLPR